MKSYQAYLIDLDGTMYRGENVIPEAIQFIKRLNEKGIPYLFVTNNSASTPEEIATKLKKMNIEAEAKHIFTSSLATAEFMAKQGLRKTVYPIGENGLITALEEKGFQITKDHPAFVVVGLDRSLTYEKLALAALAVRNGATFISTNADAAIPTERGLLPGNGSITALVATTTETKPIFIGKPEGIIMEQALLALGVAKEEAVMIGDNYETDILAGIRLGMDTAIVHTGFTSKEALKTKQLQPTYSIGTLAEWQFD
ncbi:TIGR01457 family HAD-type hydrolase [Listeria sp. PSOL-1]|uniref:TIGR01457 family HAD-type hydrolase n=1 Tax=Listeria sp. PSOL-1 TaxID=1844999 RepID=UPI0013D0CEE4|nr:TIGR01457 family HAD-type hydrolase [Listeria sp. PSOL-1]